MQNYFKEFNTSISQTGKYTQNEQKILHKYFQNPSDMLADASDKLKPLAKKLNYVHKLLGSCTEKYPKDFFDPNLMCLLADHLTMSDRITFCSIDCEFYERVPGLITEIGISVVEIDKTKPLFLPPIRNYHLVRQERFDETRNSRFVPDHRGYSTTATSVSLPIHKSREYFKEILEYWIIRSKSRDSFFVYVGHGVLQDFDVLRKNEFYLPANYVLDTSILWSYPLQKYQVSLFDIMTEMGLQQRFLHNAVNDSTITLQAAVNIIDPVFRKENCMWDYMTLLNCQDAFLKLDMDLRQFLRTNALHYEPYKPRFSKSERLKRGSLEFYLKNPDPIVGSERVDMFCFKLFERIGSDEFQKKLEAYKKENLPDLFQNKQISNTNRC